MTPEQQLINDILADFGTGIQFPFDYQEQKVQDGLDWEEGENDNYTEQEF